LKHSFKSLLRSAPTPFPSSLHQLVFLQTQYLPQSEKAVALPKTHPEWSMTGRVPALSGDPISLRYSWIQNGWFSYLTKLHVSRPQLRCPQSNLSCCWRVPDAPAALNVLAQGVSSTVYLPHLRQHKKIPTSDSALRAALTASTVWEVSLYPNPNQSHSNRLSEAS